MKRHRLSSAITERTSFLPPAVLGGKTWLLSARMASMAISMNCNSASQSTSPIQQIQSATTPLESIHNALQPDDILEYTTRHPTGTCNTLLSYCRPIDARIREFSESGVDAAGTESSPSRHECRRRSGHRAAGALDRGVRARSLGAGTPGTFRGDIRPRSEGNDVRPHPLVSRPGSGRHVRLDVQDRTGRNVLADSRRYPRRAQRRGPTRGTGFSRSPTTTSAPAARPGRSASRSTG